LFFASRLQLDGKKIMTKAEGNPQKMLHTVFNFKKQDDKSGYKNTYLNMVGIRNFSFQHFNK
jgi:hypothetical protein